MTTESYLERLQQAIASATRGLTSEDLTRPPEGRFKGKWSVGEVLEHLYLTYTGTIKGCERCLQAGNPMAGPMSLRQRARVAVMIELGYVPKGRKTPERAAPKGMPTDQVLHDIAPTIAAMAGLIDQCEARYGAGTRLLNHPILGPLTARQWRKFHWVHGYHHVKQILERRASLV